MSGFRAGERATRRDAREAIYEPPDRSLWLYMWEFPPVQLTAALTTNFA